MNLPAENHLAQQPEPGTVLRDCDECPEMVVVPAGSFMMGSPRSARGQYLDEVPRHEVTIGYPLAEGVYEVTFAEWHACVSAGGCEGYRPEDEGLGRGRQPVINASWEDAQTYVAWLSEETGEDYRLLSEAEWEYVARAGTETPWYWGEDLSGQCRYANGFDRELTRRLRAEDVRIGVQPASCCDGYRGAVSPQGCQHRIARARGRPTAVFREEAGAPAKGPTGDHPQPRRRPMAGQLRAPSGREGWRSR